VKNNYIRLLEDTSKDNAATSKIPDKVLEYDNLLRPLELHYMNELSRFRKGKLLDLGCAYGTQSVVFKKLGFDVEAADVMPELSNPKWLEKNGVPFIEANIEKAPVKPNYYDAIIMSEVIEHLNYSPVAAMQNVYDSLKNDGFLLLSTPMREHPIHQQACTGRWCNYAHFRDIPEPWNGYEFQDAHHHLYFQSELRQLLEEVGFYVHEMFPVYRGKHWYVIALKHEV
jgi:SAM-dependent methyltransferase